MVEWERHKIQGNKIPEKCAGLSACVYKDQIYVFGGQYNINDDFFPIEQYYRELFVVNINDFSWRQIQCTPQKNWPTARSHHTALIYERSNHPQMCVFGGRCSEGRIFNGILTFDLEREEDHDAWKEDSPYHAPKGRYEHSAVIFGSKMIIFGGVYHLIDQEEEEYLSNNVHVYDLTDHRWEIYPELCPTNEDMVTNDVHSGLEKASIDNNNNDDDDDNEDNNNNNNNNSNTDNHDHFNTEHNSAHYPKQQSQQKQQELKQQQQQQQSVNDNLASSSIDDNSNNNSNNNNQNKSNSMTENEFNNPKPENYHEENNNDNGQHHYHQHHHHQRNNQASTRSMHQRQGATNYVTYTAEKRRAPLELDVYPCPRRGHTAVLDGRRMIIYGGEDPKGNILSDAWILDLEHFPNMRWHRLHLRHSGPEYPRACHSAIIFGGRMFLFGGSHRNELLEVHLDTHVLRKVPQSRKNPKEVRDLFWAVIHSSKLIVFSSSNDHGMFTCDLRPTFCLPYKELKIQQKLGSGGFAYVYKSLLKSANSHVAFKELIIQTVKENDDLEFQKEVDVMQQLRHPNIVQLFYICQEPQHLGLIVEYALEGSLEDMIAKRRGKRKLKWSSRVRILMDVARGMMHLHAHKILHRDLKPANILLCEHSSLSTSNGTNNHASNNSNHSSNNNQSKELMAKIADFGLARVKQHTITVTNSKVGSPHYIAPEILRSNQGFETRYESDVYSFAIIMWEMLYWTSMSTAFRGVQAMEFTRMVVNDNFHPPLRHINVMRQDPRKARYIDLMCRCWDREPKNRPDFSEIAMRLSSCLQSLKTDVSSMLNEANQNNNRS